MSDIEPFGHQESDQRSPVVAVVDSAPSQMSCERLIVFACQRTDASPAPPEVVGGLGDVITKSLVRSGFRGSVGDVLVLDSLGQLPAATVALVGVGPKDDVEEALVRDAAIRGVVGADANVVGISLNGLSDRFASVAAEGVMLGHHQFSLASASGRLGPPMGAVEIRVPSAQVGATWGDEWRISRILAESVNWVRDLVDLPSHIATPARMAEEAVHLATEAPIVCDVLTRSRLEERRFGGVLAVGDGGETPPCVVVLRYEPTGGRAVGLAGKGITFDSGGYHLKSLNEMREMKADMCGAAAVMGAVRAAALCGIQQDVVAVLPFAENLVDRRAFRPSDVVTHYGGKTSEVVDPDNEGRVVLADALSYLAELDPEVMIDVASLTDAGGLGPDLWAVFATDRNLAKELLAAGSVSGEPGWELPLWTPYLPQLQSRIADIANANSTTDSAVLAAIFLGEFVGTLPWAHIDLGDSGYRGSGAHKQASGVGVRTLWSYLRSRAVSRR